MGGSRYPHAATLVEVGPRDGFQVESAFIPTEFKLEMIAGLVDAGLERIQVTSFVNPKRVPQMADAAEVCARLPRRDGVTYSGLALNPRGVSRAAEAGLDQVDVSISASDTHGRKNVGMGLAEARISMGEMIAAARHAGLAVRAGLQNVWGCNYEGEIPPARILELVEDLLGHGIDMLSLADSTGRANPRTMCELLEQVQPLTRHIPIVVHLHDTFGLGMANLTAALECGVTHVDTAFAGMGGCPFIPGASGNIATEDATYLMEGLGIRTGVDAVKMAACSIRMGLFLEKAFPGKLHRLIHAGKV